MEKVTYRAVEECITRLSRLYQQQPDDPDAAGLFCPEAAALRHRLKAALVKIIFLTPADFGAKGEELLWRRVFYEVLACVKRRRQLGRLPQRLEALYRAHLVNGLGFYQQLMARILLEYPLASGGEAATTAAGVAGFVDFAPPPPPTGTGGGGGVVDRSAAAAEWAYGAVHRCLLHIGDLYRYLREYKGEVALALVQRYYGMAARFNPKIGLPYNQLGTLDLGSYYNLTAVYYYLRCLACEQPFEGSRRNLATILRKNQRRYEKSQHQQQPALQHSKPVKQFAVRFLHTLYRLLQQPQQPAQPAQHHQQRRPHHNHHQQQQDAELNALCQSALASLSDCLLSPSAAACLCVRASEVDPMRPHQLADSAVLQAALSAVLCLHSLAATNSRLAHACTAFCLGLFACLLQCAIARCRHALAQAAAVAGPDATAASAATAAPDDNGDEDDDSEVVEEDDEADDDAEEAGVGRDHVDNDDDDEEEEEAGDFPGFSAASAPRRRRRQRRRRSGKVDDGDDSSDASSDCQLAFGYGEEDDEEEREEEEEDKAESEDQMVATASREGSSDGESDDGDGGEAAPVAPAPSASPFCFSYGIPSALMAPHEAEEANAAAAAASADDILQAPTEAAASAADEASTTTAPPPLQQQQQSSDQDGAAAQLLLGRVRLLQTVKLLQDWMLCQPHLLSRAVQSSCLPLWDRMAELLNLLPPGEAGDADNDCGVICPEPEERSPALPEDSHVRGLDLFRSAQRHLDFGAASPSLSPSRLDECRLRLAAVRRFGLLAVQNDQLAFDFDVATRQFLGPSAVRQASRAGQMRSLAHMRLLNQVADLETAVSKAAPGVTASHAVPSRQCLTDGLDRVQALVRSGRCVLVLPRNSIDHLDRLKRSSVPARRASRYLEAELHSGRSLINAHEFATLAACGKRLSPDTTVFLVCPGEAPPPDVPFPVRDLAEFVRQATAS